MMQKYKTHQYIMLFFKAIEECPTVISDQKENSNQYLI